MLVGLEASDDLVEGRPRLAGPLLERVLPLALYSDDEGHADHSVRHLQRAGGPFRHGCEGVVFPDRHKDDAWALARPPVGTPCPRR